MSKSIERRDSDDGMYQVYTSTDDEKNCISRVINPQDRVKKHYKKIKNMLS